jgi:hypothetical protein
MGFLSWMTNIQLIFLLDITEIASERRVSGETEIMFGVNISLSVFSDILYSSIKQLYTKKSFLSNWVIEQIFEK